MHAEQVVRHRGRPLGIAVIALFLVADAVLAIAQVQLDTPFSTRTQTLVDVADWMPGYIVLTAVVRILAAVGLWLGFRWAWILTMLVVGFGLVTSFGLYWLGDPAYLRLAVDVIIAFYLNQGVVRDYFEGSREPVVPDELSL